MQVGSFPLVSDLSFRPYLDSLRIAHWSKNLLLIVPLITAHKFADPSRLTQNFGSLFVGVVSFSLIASFGYILNDLRDRRFDSSHPRKKLRPIAASALSPIQASVFATILVVSGGILGTSAGASFLAILALYVVLSVTYTFFAKRVKILDVITVSCFFLLRIYAGGELFQIAISRWLACFSFFFFLCLAAVKRIAELQECSLEDSHEVLGRPYVRSDSSVILIIALISGALAFVTSVLYTTSHEALILYRTPELLLGACLLLTLWVSRLMFRVKLRCIDDDPLLFALRDFWSYSVALSVLILMYFAAT